MLFNFLKKKEPQPIFKDMVWLSTPAKLQGIVQLLANHPNALLAAWFPQTIQQLQLLPGIPEVADARHLRQVQVAGKVLVVAEHYPLAEKEQYLLQMQAEQVYVCSALDEPLFQHFGGEKILPLLKKMGMQESETIEHSLIKKSINRAQERLAQEVLLDRTATSASEWFRINLPA